MFSSLSSLHTTPSATSLFYCFLPHHTTPSATSRLAAAGGPAPASPS
jgi:hypothetical protein